jgi:hypothetical protein
VPEVGGEIVPLFDPRSLSNAIAKIEPYVLDATLVKELKDRVRARYLPRTWDDSAAQIERVMAATESADLPPVDFVWGDGFGPLEHNLRVTHTWRWMPAKAIAVVFNHSGVAQPLHFSFTLTSSVLSRVRVAGCGIARDLDTTGQHILETAIPPGRHEITFTTDAERTHIPGDNRDLRVMFGDPRFRLGVAPSHPIAVPELAPLSFPLSWDAGFTALQHDAVNHWRQMNSSATLTVHPVSGLGEYRVRATCDGTPGSLRIMGNGVDSTQTVPGAITIGLPATSPDPIAFGVTFTAAAASDAAPTIRFVNASCEFIAPPTE